MAPTPIDNPFANTADANMSTARLAKLRRVAADTNTLSVEPLENPF